MLRVEKSLIDMCIQNSIDILYSYGSRSNEAKEFLAGKPGIPVTRGTGKSDLDFGAKVTPGTRITVRDKVRLMQLLEDLFQESRVDLAFFYEVDPFLAANIVRGERLYCRNTLEADEFELYIFRRAGDLIPLERERQALILGEE